MRSIILLVLREPSRARNQPLIVCLTHSQVPTTKEAKYGDDDDDYEELLKKLAGPLVLFKGGGQPYRLANSSRRC